MRSKKLGGLAFDLWLIVSRSHLKTEIRRSSDKAVDGGHSISSMQVTVAAKCASVDLSFQVA